MAVKTREEVLELAKRYRKTLESKGRNPSTFGISDEWGEVRTTAGLLIQNPAVWQSHLTDDMTDGVYDVIQGWLDKG